MSRSPTLVIPAKAGIHLQVVPFTRGHEMDPRLRGDDEDVRVRPSEVTP
jgi:hypothetical protein